MKFIGNKIIAFLLIFIFTISTLPITAYAVDIKNVKVGFFQFDGYHMINEKTGERSGYGYDILQHMIGYTSWQYEYVGYDKGWNDMLTMLENGEIDILTSAQKTPEREALFDFSTKSIGSSSTILTTKAGNDKLITNNYESWNGIKVGMLNGNSRNQSFFDWANQNNFQFKAVYYENINDLTHALQTTEEVDAILTSNLRYIANEWIIAEFDPSPFYIMVQKGNTEFLNEINKVLDLLYLDEPWLNFLLDSEYYTPQSGNEIFYTT
ncbi:MAG: substrate-binding periplasmic protein, partial [Anaerotignaceae bacterium]